MNKLQVRSRSFAFLIIAILFTVAAQGSTPQTAPRSPSDTVREFYKAMHEKRFVDAFGMSIYKPAIEGLKPQEFEDLRSDFNKMADVIPEKVEISGEQISGDDAAVFVKVPKENDPSQAETEPISLIRENGQWIIGDRENQEIVKKAGNRFFFKARIDVHHSEVKSVLTRISIAQLAYHQQHNGVYADMPTLISVGLLPKDLEGTESTGYHFHIELAKDAKTFTVGAEPAQYGRTGVLSFFMDQSGVRSTDIAGRPFNLAVDRDTPSTPSGGPLVVGMTAKEVKSLWGAPDEVSTTTTAIGIEESWFYERKKTYLLFSDGRLRSINERH